MLLVFLSYILVKFALHFTKLLLNCLLAEGLARITAPYYFLVVIPTLSRDPFAAGTQLHILSVRVNFFILLANKIICLCLCYFTWCSRYWLLYYSFVCNNPGVPT